MKDFLLDPDLLEEVRQEHETILTLLEHEFLGAMITSDWREFDQFVNDFRVEASTKVLSDQVPTFSQTELTERQGIQPSCHLHHSITSVTISTELSGDTQDKKL